uniref:Peptidase A2 domain-containing protein n=1 Tax=Peronospora matthiolae TaxID=2874970 RepID=A0AAV1T6Z9_9STRA
MQTTVSSKNKYPRFEEESSDSDSDSNSEMKLVGLVAKKHTSTKLAPLRIKVQLKNANINFEALLDSGASMSIINQKNLQANVQLGRKKSHRRPSFRRKMVRNSGEEPRCYSINRDIITSLGIVLNFKENVVQWDGHYAHLNTGVSRSFEVSDYESLEESKEIAESAVRPEELMPDTLPNSLVDEYHQLLRDNMSLYDGHLGRMRFEDYFLPISPDYKPVHAKPYPVPRSLEGKARELIQHLISTDVLEKIYDSEMASPAFFLEKPNGSLRLLIDFRELNRFLQRSPYYVPRIREILLRLAGAKCLSTLDATWGTTSVVSLR